MQCGLPGWPLANHWCQAVLLCRGNMEGGFAAVTCWHGQQVTSNFRAPVYIFYQQKAMAEPLNTLGASGLCSPQCNLPALISSISPSTSKVLYKRGWAQHICMFPECCGQLILWTESQERELSLVGNAVLVYLCRHIQDSRAAAKHTTFLVASARSTRRAITGHW